MIRSVFLRDVVLVAQLDIEVAVIAPLEHPAVRIRHLECLRGGQLDLVIGVLLVVLVNDHIARILRSDRDELAAELGKGFQILDLVCRILADRKADHARADVVLREHILLLARIRDPDSLGSDGVLPGLNADQKIVVRSRDELELILRQLLRHFFHDGNFEAIGFPLLVHVVIGDIIIRMCDGDDLLSVCRLRAVRTALSAARQSCRNCCGEKPRECRLCDFVQIHVMLSFYREPAALRTQSKCFQSMSRGTVQSAPSRMPVRPAASRMRFVSAVISACVPR